MIGRTISHYKIDAELGRGGMGVVYRARDEKLHRPVALKLLSTEIFSHAERRARVLAEARAAAALNHPGIATIYEVGEEGEHIFIVMELVPGNTLRSLIAGAPLDARALARLGLQLAEALGAAHACGVIHGDIKPDNIVLLAEDRVKLLDFGVARQEAENTLTLTRSASHSPVPDSHGSGTLAYMAPEQLRGDPADGRADLYSLGVVLYELAAGHRPFPGPSASMLMSQVLQEAPPSLEKTAPHLASELGRIVHKLLEKQAGSRYQSAREIQVDLSNFLRDLDRGPALPAAVAGKRAVAVLPFKLLTPNTEDEYLRVALADAVINHLSATGELLVRPTSTVMRYASQPVDPLVAAREMNVQTIVEGSIQKLGSRLRVHAQVWNAADGSTLPSVRQEADSADLFGLQDRISEAVAVALGVRAAVSEQAPAAPPTKNAIAYELYLRAAEKLSRLNKWDMRSAIEMLEEATRLDPRFAAAWARLADACVMLSVTIEPSTRSFAQAERAIRRALALDPENGEAQSARGRILWTPAKKFKNRLALSAIEKALRVNPGLHQARLWQCLIFVHLGLHQEAEEGLAIALAAHPEDAFTLTFLGQSALWRNDYERALDYSARALRADPAHLWANVFFPSTLIYAGRLDEAEARIHTSRKLYLPTDPWLTSCEALLWASRGERRKAGQILKLALRSGQTTMLHTHHMWHMAAATYSLLGKPAPALSLLRRAGSQGMPNYPMFRDDPNLQSLHAYSPFQKWLVELKQEWESYRRDYGKPASNPG
jgi:serine/threonine-protein kinase